MFDRIYRVEEFDEAMQAEHTMPKSRTRRSGYVVGDSDDVAERQADAVADRGMKLLQHSGSASAIASPESLGDTRIRRSSTSTAIGLAGGPVDATMSDELDRATGHGQPFEPRVQRAITHATGHDVSDVRIHTDDNSDRMAQGIQASAFTVQRDIFFAAGQYRPDTAEGMHRVLHESGHLMEGGSRVRRSTIRRLVSVTTDQLDGSFKHRTGVKGLRDSMSSEIPKIRDGLKSYHAAKSTSPEKKQAALQSLIKHTGAWLAKHPRGADRGERARIDLIDSINIQANLEATQAQAAAIYMGDAAAKANNAPSASGAGSHPMQNLMHTKAFKSDSTLYDDRTKTDNKMTGGGKAQHKRGQLVAGGELAAPDTATTKAMDEALASLSPAEFAALHTYTGADYRYINPNVGGWGIGKFGSGKKGESNADKQKGAANKTKYEEAGLHAGFMAEAFRKLPIWKGTTYRGMTAETDFLGLTTASSYTPKEFWSTSEARSVAKNFLNVSAITAGSEGKKPTMAIMCTIKVSNARDVSRLSDAPEELEIMLPPSSQLAIGKQQCFIRGKDDAAIKLHFGDAFFATHTGITNFWLIDMTQGFSGDDDVVGAYPSAKGAGAGKALPKLPGGRMPALPKIPGT